MGKKTGPKPMWQDPAVVDTIVEVLEDGMAWNMACTIAGVHPATLRRWRGKVSEWGREAEQSDVEPELVAVVERLEMAKARGERVIVSRMLLAMKGWQRFAWLLERTNPTEYSTLEHFRGRLAAEPEPAAQSARHEKVSVDEIRQAVASARSDIEAV